MPTASHTDTLTHVCGSRLSRTSLCSVTVFWAKEPPFLLLQATHIFTYLYFGRINECFIQMLDGFLGTFLCSESNKSKLSEDSSCGILHFQICQFSMGSKNISNLFLFYLQQFRKDKQYPFRLQTWRRTHYTVKCLEKKKSQQSLI